MGGLGYVSLSMSNNIKEWPLSIHVHGSNPVLSLMQLVGMLVGTYHLLKKRITLMLLDQVHVELLPKKKKYSKTLTTKISFLQ